MSKHGNQQNPPPAGEVWVDDSIHAVVRAGDTPEEDEVVGRTRTTPTKHDGTQTQR